MNESSPLWREIAPSEYPWEREALAFVRAGLPHHEPYRAWANLELVAEDGGIHEVDLLVVTPRGFYLVEIKSWSGRLEGDATTWFVQFEGRPRAYDSPLLLANRKARKLASLLRRQKALRGAMLPFLEPLVFLSNPGLDCRLAGTALQGVYLRDRPAEGDRPARPGICAALTAPFEPGARPRIDVATSQRIARALEEAGIRPTQRSRRAGDFVLEEILADGPGYQDWLAHHERIEKVRRRVRIYSAPPAAGAEVRKQLERAARRELEALETLAHPGLLKPMQLTTSERGPALVFEYEPQARRLDHFLAEQGRRLGFGERVRLVRQLGEILQFVHDKRLYHRALSPASVLVWNPGAEMPALRVLNWQTALHEELTTGTPGRLTGATEVAGLIDDAEQVYVAPEALSVPDAQPETLDVFSLGAVAHLIFSGQPPAKSVLHLHELLGGGRGLQLAAALDGADPRLCELIDLATRPVVAERIASVSDFLSDLDVIEKELARPEGALEEDPTAAGPGELLPGGWRVRQRLGRGSTGTVFLVEKDGREQVLKLSFDAATAERLRTEAEVLRKLDHPTIVALNESITLGERFGLLLGHASEGTLARRLRQDGRLQLELLERFGEDLLQALCYLEAQGVPHRDIKPDNLGVTKRNGELHLLLFDFSLSRVSPESIFAGTRPYLDPFLKDRRRRRWDLYAERFAAGVTLYEMAFGVLPQWGDGQSDPSLLREEVRIEAELLDGAVRAALTEFFRRALARSPEQRFDNADDMLAAWRRAFATSEPSTLTTTTEEQPDELAAACARASLETAVDLLGLSTRAANALERAQVATVRDLLRLPLFRVNRLRGVGSKTRRELVAAIRLLTQRLGSQSPPLETPAPAGPPVAGAEGVAALSLDLLVAEILATAQARGASQRRVAERFLGLAAEAEPPASGWATQTETAEALGLTRARVNQVLGTLRSRWQGSPAVEHLRSELAEVLAQHGHAMTARELALSALARRGSEAEEPWRSRRALAVVRAACEVEESTAAPRWRVRRRGERVLVALDQPAGAEAVLDYAEALGRKADELAEQDPLPSPQRALEVLQAVRRPESLPLSTPERLLKLATAAGRQAALSSRLELYPRGLAPDRALRLASGSLLGASHLTPADVQARIASRFPEAAPLPGRPGLDELLREVGLDLEWQAEGPEGAGAYRFRELPAAGLSSSTYRRTTLAPETPGLSPEVLTAQLFDERLARAAREGAFLVLTVEPPEMLAAEERLAGSFPLESVSLEARWLAAMRRLGERHGVDWRRVLAADAEAPEHPDRQNLQRFAREALTEVEEQLAASPRPVLLLRAGLLARYGQMALLDRLRERVQRRRPPDEPGLPGLWVLAVVDPQTVGPNLDGTAISVLTRAQWEAIPRPWLERPPVPPASLAPPAVASEEAL